MSDPFDFDAPAFRFAVMGNPVKHSKSPLIHRRFGVQTGVRLEYTAIQVDPGGFIQAVDNFRANGGRGLNITVPFKIEAFRYADQLNPRAQQAGAVNTLIFERDRVVADNTDGAGIVRDITVNLGVCIAGKHLLLVGAGGAARGAMGPILACAPASLTIVNRTVDKAYGLVNDFKSLGNVEARGYPDLGDKTFDIIINATSASLTGDLPALPANIVTNETVTYDMMYGSEQTVFSAWGEAHGARLSADGLGMLVEQAAESFELWNGIRPETASVIAALRAGESLE